MAESILFLCAHNDDQTIGAGGTIAKYAKEGKKIITVIFSFGEKSLPHLENKTVRRTRVLESKKAAKILGESEVYYLGLKEGEFKKEVAKKDIFSKIKIIIDREKPTRIFTHSMDDPHPDHRAVFAFVKELLTKIDYDGEVYSFNIWNFFINFRLRNEPRLIVDITATFKAKVDAVNKHKSQLPALISLMWNVYLRAIMHGFNNNMRYAEVFYKLK
jgi:LmbE family N-acetylglucosaminyl deacetylase